MKTKTALLFGSFNPIHNGHLSIANYLISKDEIEEVMLVVSPLSPFKLEKSLINADHRFNMASLAVKSCKKITVSDVEFNMPKPSYTIDTLRELRSLYPEKKFVLVMGFDNLTGFERWKEYDEILRLANIYVYPRGEESEREVPKFEYTLIDAPLFPISSTILRERIKEGLDIKDMVPSEVDTYIKENKLYKTN